MKIRAAEAFCKLVELGGIALAAEAMHCVPSNITKMIKELESDLREPLFNRQRGRLVLTPFGRQYYQDVLQLTELNRKIENKFKRNDGGYTLTIGAIDVAADHWLPARMVAFMASHPEIQLTLFRGYSRALEEGLYQHKFDLIFSDGPVISPEVQSIPAFTERLLLAGNPQQCRTTPIPLYGFSHQCLYRTMTENWLANQPSGRYQIMDMESYPAMKALLQRQFGVGFIPERILQEMGAEALAETGIAIRCDVHAVWHHYNRHPAIDTFLEAILAPDIISE